MTAALPVPEDATASGGAGRPHPISQRLHEQRTTGERLADAIAHHIGSWRFLIVQTILVAVWIAINAIAVASGWDPYPFVLLNLLFSVQAAYTGPVLLLSQNRSAQRDRMMADLDFINNEKGEQLVEALLSEVLRNSQATLAIASHLGIELDHLEEQSTVLDDKIDTVEDQLVEVEDVLGEDETKQPDSASDE